LTGRGVGCYVAIGPLDGVMIRLVSLAPKRVSRSLSLIVALLVALPQFLLSTTVPVSAQDDSAREAGQVVGTTGLNIRKCPDVSCASVGLAQLLDPVIVTGPEQDGYLPVQWSGKSGWAWGLYVATDSRGTPFLEQGTSGCNRVAIIFDIGIGEPLQTHPLLWLKSQNVPATVFAMGWWALKYPDDLRTVAMLGFPIGTHGDVRLNLTGFADDEIVQDIRDSATHIRQVTGDDPVPYMTPYAADSDERVRGLIASEGYLPVLWDVPADDWDENITADYVYNRVVPNVVDGSIIEMHLDGPSTAQSTAVALPRIVKDLQAKGFHFVTIPDMAQPCPKATPVPSR
jgi:peptidoglycan/xylan/chitin deacetylase (PgdA/CDA1 family)